MSRLFTCLVFVLVACNGASAPSPGPDAGDTVPGNSTSGSLGFAVRYAAVKEVQEICSGSGKAGLGVDLAETCFGEPSGKLLELAVFADAGTSPADFPTGTFVIGTACSFPATGWIVVPSADGGSGDTHFASGGSITLDPISTDGGTFFVSGHFSTSFSLADGGVEDLSGTFRARSDHAECGSP